MNLIEKQAFGPFELNPLNYYQGTIKKIKVNF